MDTGNCTSTCINMDRHMKRRMDMHNRMKTRTNTYLNSSRALPRQIKHSATGTRTRVARVRAEYPNQLDYSGAGFQIYSTPSNCVNIHKDTLETKSRYMFDDQQSSLCVFVCVCELHGPSRLRRACRISGHTDSNRGPFDCCRGLQSDALPTEL